MFSPKFNHRPAHERNKTKSAATGVNAPVSSTIDPDFESLGEHPDLYLAPDVVMFLGYANVPCIERVQDRHAE